MEQKIIMKDSGPGRGLNPGPRTVNTLERIGLNTRSANHTARPPGQLLGKGVLMEYIKVAQPAHPKLGNTAETPQPKWVLAGSFDLENH